jgi:pimeloyl-ACP methyl ester carboxylesterase
MAGST